MNKRKMYLDKIIQFMKNDYPLFKNLKMYGFYEQLSEDELNYVLSGVFGQPVNKGGGRSRKNIYNQNGKIIYVEDSNGDWVKKEYDDYGKEIYYENSDGYWIKWEYDENGNKIYYENYKGYWIKWEYDDNRNQIYSEDSNNNIYDNR